VVQQNLARRHLSTKERAELSASLVVNGGVSVREAAARTRSSKSSVQRRAVAARKAGVPAGTPGRSRTTGADGKSYPATRSKNPTRMTATERYFDTMARHYVEVVRAHDALRMLLGCVVMGGSAKRGRRTRVEVTSIGYERDGRAYVTGGEEGKTRLLVEDIMRIEKLPPRP
jgi:transposase